MGIPPLVFTGISSYSQDFQTVLNRAVSIASLPLRALQNESADLLNRKTQLSNFSSAVDNLANSLQSLGQVGARKGLTASSSDTSKVTVTNTGADAANVYILNSITSLAQQASETSVTGYANSSSTPVSSNGTVRLTVGSQNYTISLSGGTNNLVGLRNAINALGSGVTASILTTGTGPNPNYLSVTANTTGATTLRLVDDPGGAATNLLTSANQGSNAVFQLNGISISRASNQVNDVIPGLSFSLQATSSSAVSLTLTSQRSQLTDGLRGFVSSYNAMIDQVNTQVGPGAGLLSGDLLVRETQKTLREITNFAGPGAVRSLTDLGITFGNDGKANLDTAKINSFTDGQLNSAFEFLGSNSTGLASLGGKLKQISDPVTGLVKLQQDGYSREDLRLQRQIADLEARVTTLQRNTASRLQSVDALLGSLEAQRRVIDSTVQSVNFSLFGKKE
jgi:flagellar hook-associated protein 2